VTDAQEIASDAIAAAAGDEAEAVVLTECSGLARFAEREVNQPTLIDNVVVTLRVVRDGKVGVAATNRIDADGLRELARRAGEAADSALVEPTFPGLAPPAEVPQVEGWDKATASLSPEDQARLARAAIEASELGVYGFFTSAQTSIAICSTTGVAVSQPMTDATTLVVAADLERSGYAEATSWRAGDLAPAEVAREAADKAERTNGSAEAGPARYRAVLEPYAIAALLEYFSWDTFGAQGLLEERSYFSGRIGERAFDEKVTIVDDALDPRGLPKAFDFEGVPKERVVLVGDGVIRGVVWDRATAAEAGGGARSTGHAPPASLRAHGPYASALAVGGGTAESVDELVELVGDGIYVTRLHYLSVVDPREGIVTGMTRDGTFRIRDGRVAEPLVNLRFTVSVPELLADVPGLTREVALVNANDFYGERYPVGILVPALATASFNITGAGSAPGL
jgi:PmbA protein